MKLFCIQVHLITLTLYLLLNHYEFLRKDRSSTLNKAGGGVIMYYRDSINYRRKTELEISNTETLLSEINFPSSKPFLLCAIYRSTNRSFQSKIVRNTNIKF